MRAGSDESSKPSGCLFRETFVLMLYSMFIFYDKFKELFVIWWCVPDNVFSRADIFYSRTDWRRNRISWQGRVVILSYNTFIELALEFCCFLTVNISRLIYAAGVIWDAWFLVHTVWGRWDRLLADGWWWDGYTVCCKYHLLSDID